MILNGNETTSDKNLTQIAASQQAVVQPPNYVVVLTSLGWQGPSVPSALHTCTAVGQSDELYIDHHCQTAGKANCVQILETEASFTNFKRALQARTYNGVYLSDEKVLLMAWLPQFIFNRRRFDRWELTTSFTPS